METKIRVEEHQVKALEEHAFERAIKETNGNRNFSSVYQHLMDGILAGLLEVASNPDEVEEFLKAWRRD